MQAPRHPDDPRPLPEQFARCYPDKRVVMVGFELDAFRHQHRREWRPAPWHYALMRERARWEAQAERAA